MFIEIIIVLGIFVYTVAGLLLVTNSASDILEEEDIMVKHLLIVIVFLPITLIFLALVIFIYVAMLLEDTTRDSSLVKFLNKTIKVRR